MLDDPTEDASQQRPPSLPPRGPRKSGSKVSTNHRRKVLLGVGAIVAVLVVLGAYWFLQPQPSDVVGVQGIAKSHAHTKEKGTGEVAQAGGATQTSPSAEGQSTGPFPKAAPSSKATEGSLEEVAAARVARALLQAVEKKDARLATALLTRKAQEKVEAGDLTFEPETWPALRVGKVTLKDDRAEVSLIPINDVGEEPDASLRLRKESGEWRIYAMAFREDPAGPVGVFDLENPDAFSQGMAQGLEQAMEEMALGSAKEAALEAERVSAITAMDREAFEASWRIDVDVKGRPAGEVLEPLLKDLGMGLEESPEVAEALTRPVTVRFKGRSRLEAVEEVCRQVGLYPVYPQKSESGLGLVGAALRGGLEQVVELPEDAVAQEPPEPPLPSVRLETGPRPLPIAFAGPFLIEAVEVSELPPDAVGSLKLRASGFGLPPGIVTLSADRHDLLALERVAASQTDNLLSGGRLSQLAGRTRSSIQVASDVNLRHLFRPVTALEVIKGKVTIPVPTRIVSLRFDNLQEGEVQSADGVQVVLRDVREGESSFTLNNRTTKRKTLSLRLEISGVDFQGELPNVKLLAFDRRQQPLEVSSWGASGGESAFKEINVQGDPDYLIAKVIAEIDQAEYPFELTAIPLQSFGQQPEGIEPLEFAGHEAPVSVEVVGFGGKRIFDEDRLVLHVRVTNHSNKDVVGLSLLCTYFDAAGGFVEQRSSPESGMLNLNTGRTEPVVAKGATARIQAGGFFAPKNAKTATAALESVTFADGTKWEADKSALAGAIPIPALIEMLKEQDFGRHMEASRLLSQFGQEAVPPLIELAGGEDIGLRKEAIEILGRIGPDAQQATPVLIASLGDPDGAVGGYAATALGRIGSPAVAGLTEALAHDEARVRKWACFALGKVGPSAGEAVPALITALQDPDASVRMSAFIALRDVGPSAGEAVPALITALQDSDASVRIQAAEALWRINGQAGTAVEALVAVLKEQDTGAHRSAAYVLGRIGPEAKAAVPALTEALDSKNVWVRMSAADALLKIDERPEAIPALIALLQNANPNVRRAATAILGEVGPPAKEALPAIQALLEDSDQWVQEAAAKALQKIESVASDHSPRSPVAQSPSDDSPSKPTTTTASQNKPFVPKLLAPTPGSIMDNGCTDRTDGIVWDFDWSDVPGATDYHLVVEGRGAQGAVIDTNVQGSKYHYESPQSYIAGRNTRGWRWTVRARVDGAWKGWSESRSFDVEPLNTDCRRQ